MARIPDLPSRRDGLFRRIRRTPPPPRPEREKPRCSDEEELLRELDKGADIDLDKIARIIGNKNC